MAPQPFLPVWFNMLRLCPSTPSARPTALAVVLASLLLTACPAAPPEGGAHTPGGTPAAADAAPAPSTVASELEAGPISTGAGLSVDAQRAGTVYLDGVVLAPTTPTPRITVAAKRSSLQVLLPDRSHLSTPRPVLTREGMNTRVLVRNESPDVALTLAEDTTEGSSAPGTPFSHLPGVPMLAPGIDPFTGLAANSAEGSAGDGSGAEGSAGAGAEGSSDAAAPAEASAAAPTVVPAVAIAEAGSGATPVAAAGSGATPVADGSAGSGAAPADGSAGSGAAAAEASAGSGSAPALPTWLLTRVTPYTAPNLERTRLYVVSDPPGELYVGGRPTGWITPVLMDVPAGEVSVQVIYPDGRLSRHLPIESLAGQGRSIFLRGQDFAAFR